MVFIAQWPLVLASGSPRRRDMLAGLGLDFRVVPSQAPEPEREPGEEPGAYAVRTARAKGKDVAVQETVATLDDVVILAADTVVVVDQDVLGKPLSEAEALAMLKRLAGRTHHVVTGCWLGRAHKGGISEERFFTAGTEVDMHPWPDEALQAYVATGEPMDKAGAYGIQGKGSFLVSAVRGSYTNVVGLPLCKIMDMLLYWRPVPVVKVG